MIMDKNWEGKRIVISVREDFKFNDDVQWFTMIDSIENRKRLLQRFPSDWDNIEFIYGLSDEALKHEEGKSLRPYITVNFLDRFGLEWTILNEPKQIVPKVLEAYNSKNLFEGDDNHD